MTAVILRFMLAASHSSLAKIMVDSMSAASLPILERVARIGGVFRSHDVPLAAAAPAFPLAHPAVVSVIPGGQTPRGVWQNAPILSYPIPSASWRDPMSLGLLRPDTPVPRAEK